MLPRPTIEAFDSWLEQSNVHLEAIVIGGSALALLGSTSRQTKDFDILDPELSQDVISAAKDFASHVRVEGGELEDDWFNNGPIQLAEVLPGGWRLRLQVVFVGRRLTLKTLGRLDFLKAKLFALCDRGIDLADCIALSPTASELSDAAPWLSAQDANPPWPDHVRDTLRDLNGRLGHGIH